MNLKSLLKQIWEAIFGKKIYARDIPRDIRFKPGMHDKVYSALCKGNLIYAEEGGGRPLAACIRPARRAYESSVYRLTYEGLEKEMDFLVVFKWFDTLQMEALFDTCLDGSYRGVVEQATIYAVVPRGVTDVLAILDATRELTCVEMYVDDGASCYRSDSPLYTKVMETIEAIRQDKLNNVLTQKRKVIDRLIEVAEATISKAEQTNESGEDD